jgi:hypothetical protein
VKTSSFLARHFARPRWPVLLPALLALLAAGHLPAQRADMDARSQQILRRFPEADKNKDGKLDAEELRAFVRTRRGGETPHSPAPKPAPSAAQSEAGAFGVAVATPAQPGRVNPRLYGLNCAEMITKGLLDVPEYVEAIAELRLKTLQYPGGSASYWHHPTGKGGLNARPEEVKKSAKGEQSRWMQQTSGPDRFGQYLDLCKRSGAEALFIANIMHGNPQEMDAFLQRIRAADVGIAAVALGQEMHLAPGTVGLGLEEYLRRIGPHIELLKKKYPGVLIAAPATPVGRVEGRRLSEGMFEWNRALAKVPGLDGFAQYGWTEFGGMARRAERSSTEEGWASYRDFVRAFPTEQLPAYQRYLGTDKKYFMTQWGTHGDQNTPLQGVHLAACTATPVAPDDPADDRKISCAPNALLMVNCVADFRDMDETAKFKQRVPGGAEMGARLSPIRHLGSGWPPTLILVGDLDRWFGLAKTFVDTLTSHGVRAELWIAPGEGHPFSNFSPWREASMAKTDEFLASLGWLQGPPAITVPPAAQWQRHVSPGKTSKPSPQSN